MILLYNIISNDSIEFEDNFLIRNDSILVHDNSESNDNYFVTLELPRGFDWLDHTRDCEVCRNFLNAVENNLTAWFIGIDNDWWLVDTMSGFGAKNSHNLAHLSTSTGEDGVAQSWLKLKIRPVDKEFLENRLTEELKKENYDRCHTLKNVLKNFPTKTNQ